jgi:O-antigen/teichoic acid export membrane protein
MANKDFLKNSGILVSGSMLGQLIIFAALPIITRIYTPEQFGEITIFMQIVSVLLVLGSFRLELGIVVEDDWKKSFTLMKLALLFSFVFTILVTLSIVFPYNFWLKYFKLPLDTTWLYFIPVALLLNSWGEILVQWHTRERQFKTISAGRLSGSIFSTLIKILHPTKFGANTYGLIFGQLALFLITFIIYLPKKLKSLFQFNFGEMKEMLIKYKNFPLWGTPAALINTLGFALPVMILNFYADRETVGFYGNAVKVIFTPLTVLSMSFSQVFFEHISRIKHQVYEANNYVIYTLKRIIGIAIFPTLFVVFFGKPVFAWLFDQQWEMSGYFAQITMVYFFVIYLTSPFAAAFTIYDKLKSQLLFTLLFTVVNNIALIMGIYFTKDVAIGLLSFAISGIVIRFLMMGYYFHLYGKKRNILIAIMILIGIALTVLGWY